MTQRPIFQSMVICVCWLVSQKTWLWYNESSCVTCQQFQVLLFILIQNWLYVKILLCFHSFNWLLFQRQINFYHTFYQLYCLQILTLHSDLNLITLYCQYVNCMCSVFIVFFKFNYFNLSKRSKETKNIKFTILKLRGKKSK